MATTNCSDRARPWLIAACAGLSFTAAALAGDKAPLEATKSPSHLRQQVSTMTRADEALVVTNDEPVITDRVAPDCTVTGAGHCIGGVTLATAPTPGNTSALWSDINGAVPVNPIARLDSKVCNNFTPTTAGNINQICWIGRYTAYRIGQPSSVAGVGITPPPATRTFRISYFLDNGFGLPSCTPIAQFTVGATSPTAGTDHSAAQVTGSTWRFTATHPDVAVTANSCVWVEIIDIDNAADITISGNPHSPTFRWFCTYDQATNAPSGPNTRPVDDRQFWALGNPNTLIDAPYSGADEDLGDGDAMFCVTLASVTQVGAGTCPNIPTGTPPNDDIDSRTSLTIDAAAINGTLSGASQDLRGVRPCGTTMGDGAGVWYQVTGNGQTLTVTTDFAGNCTDTEIIVYDARAYTNGGPVRNLACVGDDDDSSATLGSTVSWCSENGISYIIYVQGAFNGGGWADGPFKIQVTQGTGGCTPVAPNLNCDVVAQMGDTVSTEVCGSGSDINGECNGSPDITTPEFVVIDGPANFATTDTVFQASREFDCYNFTVTGAPKEISVELTSELPLDFFLVECTGTPPSINDANSQQLFGVVVPTCVTGELLQVLVPVGNWTFLATAHQFGGADDCSLGWTDYRLKVTSAPTGNCCNGTTCGINTEIACNNVGGHYVGDDAMAACTPGPCTPPCSVTLGTPVEAEACFADASLSVNDDCANAEGPATIGTPVYGVLFTDSLTFAGNGFRDLDAWAFTQAATGDLDILLKAESDVLFQVVACPAGTVVAGSTTNVARCNTTATTLTALPAGDYICVVTTQDFFGAPCASGVNNYELTIGGAAPCPGNHDGNGQVDADDLFAFLDDWFAENGVCTSGCVADYVPAPGVDADDLFAYLDIWFANNGNVCP